MPPAFGVVLSFERNRYCNFLFKTNGNIRILKPNRERVIVGKLFGFLNIRVEIPRNGWYVPSSDGDGSGEIQTSLLLVLKSSCQYLCCEQRSLITASRNLYTTDKLCHSTERPRGSRAGPPCFLVN